MGLWIREVPTFGLLKNPLLLTPQAWTRSTSRWCRRCRRRGGGKQGPVSKQNSMTQIHNPLKVWLKKWRENEHFLLDREVYALGISSLFWIWMFENLWSIGKKTSAHCPKSVGLFELPMPRRRPGQSSSCSCATSISELCRPPPPSICESCPILSLPPTTGWRAATRSPPSTAGGRRGALPSTTPLISQPALPFDARTKRLAASPQASSVPPVPWRHWEKKIRSRFLIPWHTHPNVYWICLSLNSIY